MAHFPPANAKEWCKVLEKLGFVPAERVGKGTHAYKYVHPERTTSDYKVQPDFLIVQHNMYKLASQRLIRELKFFGFSRKEVEKACK